jgi:hypothetical protein
MTAARSSATARRAEAWHRARAHWSLAIELKPPRQTTERQRGAIACIDLRTRQTWVDFTRLRALGLEDCTEALLAHEVGHHIRYPNTLVEAYRLTRFLREELGDLFRVWGEGARLAAVAEGRWDVLVNLLFDLLINTALRPAYEDDFVRIYRALTAGNPPDALFAWYLGLYEEGWYLTPGTLVPPDAEARLSALRPGWRPAARACFEFLFDHAGERPLHLKPLLPALPAAPEAAASLEGARPFGGGVLTPEESRRVLARTPAERAARRWRTGLEGAVLGGVDPARSPAGGTGGGVPAADGGDPVRDLQDVLRGLCEPVEVARATYARLARRAEVTVPRGQRAGEAETPGPTAAWQLGDRLEEIDWLATLSRHAVAVPGFNLERRTWLPEGPRPGERLSPWIELYVDCSGSMPDPVRAFNAGILAGFVLVEAALRAGGRCRVITYSHLHRAMPTFVASERLAHAGLLTYIGGGTRFPWDLLWESARKYRSVAAVTRVVLSDADFLANYEQPDVVAPGFTPPQLVAAALTEATRAPDALILLLAAEDDGPEVAGLRAAGARVVSVQGWSDLPAVARNLVKVLFPDAEQSPEEEMHP